MTRNTMKVVLAVIAVSILVLASWLLFFGTPDRQLDSAALLGKTAKMRWALEHGADPNIGMHHGLRPLEISSSNGRADAVTLLLAFGANPNLESDFGTPLGFAIEARSSASVKALLAAGADKRKPHRGKTPLELARAWGDKSVIAMLSE